jgi:hypothetical protein
MAEIPETLFRQVYGRVATEADLDRLVRVKAGLGLSEQDEYPSWSRALWLPISPFA